MATEAAPNANGVFDNQYSQPAELAASIPSQGVASQSQSSPSTQQKADPQEIGWYFVEQYYTTLSKTPERIHLFYSKKSQLVTGSEAEKVVPAVGSKAISEKIKTLDIQDCKVRVLNVDSQSSFDNIVVQVIGALSNKSQPHHKFVQTFVLATQPNGYFVLNDIFRYLNDEEDEIVEDETAEEPVQVTENAPQAEETTTEVTHSEEVVDNEAAVEAVDEKLNEAIDEPLEATEADTNGVEAKPESVESVQEESTEPATSEAVEDSIVEQPAEPEPTPTVEAPTKPLTEAPATKPTWASLVGNKAPAIPALPTTTATTSQPKATRPTQPVTAPKAIAEPAATGTAAPSTTITTNTPPAPSAPSAVSATSAASTQNNGWQTADHSKKTRAPQQKASEGVVHAYIKNVTEKVDARILREVLEKFGELKYFDVSRPRNCAFVEFADSAGYAAAVAANPHDIGGEPISVEERRPRPGQFNNNNNNNPSFGRGGGNAARGRGGLQSRAGNQGNFQKEGRGGFTQRGAKSGNVTPKGRGQAQAA